MAEKKWFIVEVQRKTYWLIPGTAIHPSRQDEDNLVGSFTSLRTAAPGCWLLLRSVWDDGDSNEDYESALVLYETGILT